MSLKNGRDANFDGDVMAKKMSQRHQILKTILQIVGLAMIANGIWMVASAIEWFFSIPADMPATGEPNGHLIRDVGIAYVVFGIALHWCALQLNSRRFVLLMVAMFMIFHALGHAFEILFGALPTSHWWIDFPFVFLPGLFFAALAFPKIWAWLVGEIDLGG